MIENIHLAYLAGLMDGEGTIMINKSSRGHMHGRIAISMTDPSAAMWAHSLTKFGSLNTNKYTDRQRPLNKSYYRWCITGKAAVEFINLLLPYLQVRRRQAELFIQFMSIANTKQYYEQRAALCENMKLLNKRGA